MPHTAIRWHLGQGARRLDTDDANEVLQKRLERRNLGFQEPLRRVARDQHRENANRGRAQKGIVAPQRVDRRVERARACVPHQKRERGGAHDARRVGISRQLDELG